MNKIVRYLVVVTLLSTMATAQNQVSEFEAESFYKAADVNFKSGLYQNALTSAYLAREDYVALGSQWGVQRCDNLILQIEGVLSQPQLAGIYLQIAGDYYLQTETDIRILNRAVEMAERAKRIYQQIGGVEGSTGLLKCEDIIQVAKKKIGDAMSVCVRAGDDFYDKAQSSLFSGFYLTAKNFASNASIKYANCPYQRGVDDTASLLTTINNKIEDIRVNSKAAYDKALEYFAANNMDACKQYAAESQSLYTKIGDIEGYAAATLLASRCAGEIDRWEDDMKKQAAQYLEEGKRFSVIPNVNNCVNATDRIDKARAIYEQLYKKAQDEEENNPVNQRPTMEYYTSLISETNRLMSKVQDTCGQERMRVIAEEYYRKSQEFYLDLSLNDALSYANNARSIFSNLRDYVGISKTDTLIEQIRMVMSQRQEAEAYMRNAQTSYSVAIFDDASINANKAKVLYTNIHDKNGITAASDLLANNTAGINKLNDANVKFSKAQGQFELAQYDAALQQATLANRIYTEINYAIGIAESERIMALSNEQIEAASAAQRSTMIFIGVLAVISAILIYQYLVRKRTLEMESKTRNRQQDETFRRKDEEFQLRSEEDTKSRVDDELRKLIESERNKIEEK